MLPVTYLVTIGGQADTGAWLAAGGALTGALMDALVGGGISYALQKREHDRADALRDADRLTTQKSIAHRLIVKLMGILSDLRRLEAHMADQIAKVADGQPAWPIVLPLHVSLSPLAFEADETALLLDLGLNQEFNLMVSLPDLRNQLHELMGKYAEKRERMWAMMPPEAFVEGGVQLPRQLYLQTEALRQEMSDVLTHVHDSVPHVADEAQKGLDTIHAALARELKLTFTIEMMAVPDAS